MKDYFDLWVLLHNGGLDDADLARAIRATFERRGTALPASVPVGLSEEFAPDPTKQAQWRAFLSRNGLDTIEFTELLGTLRTTFQRLGLA